MTNPLFTEYEWKVTLVQARQGFAKRPLVRAINHEDAIAAAFSAIERENYDAGEFIVTGLERRSVTRMAQEVS